MLVIESVEIEREGGGDAKYCVCVRMGDLSFAQYGELYTSNTESAGDILRRVLVESLSLIVTKPWSDKENIDKIAPALTESILSGRKDTWWSAGISEGD